MAAKTSTPDIAEPALPQTRSGRDALVEVMVLRPRSGKDALLETLEQRYAPPVKTLAERRAELASLRLADYETAEMAGLRP
jgi:hypothetical protein